MEPAPPSSSLHLPSFVSGPYTTAALPALRRCEPLQPALPALSSITRRPPSSVQLIGNGETSTTFEVQQSTIPSRPPPVPPRISFLEYQNDKQEQSPLPLPRFPPQMGFRLPISVGEKAEVKAEDLSALSCANLNLPPTDEYKISDVVLKKIRRQGENRNEVIEIIFAEIEAKAIQRKHMVRAKLKKNLKDQGARFKSVEKTILRSRREARVHRVKELEQEKAMRNAIRQLIREFYAQRCTCQC